MGLSHAFHAANAGLRVAVFERDPEACGASVRNFGMLAVVAQAPGAQLDSARRSLACWQDVAQTAGFTLYPAGCLFLARAEEEMAVMEESLASNAHGGHNLALLTPEALSDHAAPIMSENFLGGLWSTDAWKVDQRSAMAKFTDWLRRERGVTFHFGTTVKRAESGVLATSASRFTAEHIVVCGGDEFDALFPEAISKAGVRRCQLQMMRTAPQPANWRLAPFVLGGLSLTRYNLFANCPSLAELRTYQQKALGRHIEHGIHVIACQENDGSITIGDSHDYGPGSAERSEEIDRLIMSEVSHLLALPEPRIAERWLGHYAHHPEGETLVLQPEKGVTAVTMTNGQGMTHGFSVAKDIIDDVFG